MARSTYILGAIGLSCLIACGGARAAENWTKAPREFQKLGVRLLVCKDISEQLICLGLGCAGGQSQLISIRSASGAFTGAVEAQIPPKSIELRFSDNDDRLADLAGASASRATIDPGIIDAMLDAPRVKIHDRKEDDFTESYSTRGLKSHLRSGASLCE